MKKTVAILIIATVLLTALCSCAQKSSISEITAVNGMGDSWFCGYGKKQIAIPEGETLFVAGYNQEYSATGVLDGQSVSAVILKAGNNCLLLVSSECIGLFSDMIIEIKAEISKETAIPTENIHISSTHTHAGADTMGLWGGIGKDGKNASFMKNLKTAVVTASKEALESVKEGRLYYSYSTVKNLQRDSREPQIFDENIYQIRFEPKDGSGFRIVNYAAHAEALRSQNSLLSADYPAYIAKAILRETGDETIFFAGAIGGLIMTERLRDENRKEYEVTENVVKTGELLASALLSVTEETEIEPSFSAKTVKITVPLDNKVFMTYAWLGIIDKTVHGFVDYSTETYLSLLKIGSINIVLVPGELFPELAYGRNEYEEFYPCNRNVKNPPTFAEIIGEDFLVFGLSDDEIGYIVPPDDFLLDEEKPWLNEAVDKMGRTHYEEANSLGSQTAELLAKALAKLEKS